MDRNLALEFVRVTEAAAIGAAGWIGRGDKNAADGAAVDAMRARFNQVNFSGTVVIGEGEKDKAPKLYTGEKVGKGGEPAMDLAIDPLECTRSVALGRWNAMSVIVAGAKDSLFSAPDTYMQKIAVGKEAASLIDIDAPVEDNLKKTAKALGKEIGEITVVVIDKPRHDDLIKRIRRAGARVRIFTDGDLSGAVSACFPDNEIDMMIGTGGTTEAVLASAAVKIMGGQILCRFDPQNKEHVKLIKDFGFTDTNVIYQAKDLAKGNRLTFTATGIIDGPLLSGVVVQKDRIITHSMVLRGKSGTMRYITTHHDAFKK